MASLSKSQFEKAQQLTREHRLQDAVRLCRLILLSNPKFLECRILLAQNLLTLARYEEVLAETQILVEQAPDTAEVYALKGEAHFFRGEYMAARRALTRAAELDPSNKKVRGLLADIEPALQVGQAEHEEVVTDLSTKSYPLGEDESEADPTELMESPPDEAAFEETLRRLGEESGDEAWQPAVRDESAPPDESTQDREDVSDEAVTALREGASSAVLDADGPGESRSVPGETETVPLKPGSRSGPRPARIEAAVALEEAEEQGGPRGSVFKFVPSDQVVTIEEVAVTTGEIRSEEEEESEAVTKAEPVASLRKRRKAVTPPSDDWGEEPSVEVSGIEAEAVEVVEEPPVRRLRRLSRRLPPPVPVPGGELEDVPTTPHLDLKKVPPKLPQASEPDEPVSLPSLEQEPPARPSPIPDFVPAGAGRRPVAPAVPSGAPRRPGAGPRGVVPRPSGPQAVPRPAPVQVSGRPQAPGALPAAPQAHRKSPGPAGPEPGRPGTVRSPGPAPQAPAPTSRMVRPAVDQGKSVVTPALKTEGRAGVRGKRWLVLGGAALVVILLGTGAGLLVVSHRRKARVERLVARALAALARGTPQALRAAEFAFGEAGKLPTGRQRGRAGRALVRFVSALEYGADPKLGVQILRGQRLRGSLGVAARILGEVVQGHGAGALRASKAALVKYPKSSLVFYARAWALADAGDVEGARSALVRALELKPDLGVLGRVLMVRLLGGLGRWKQAKELAGRLQLSHPGHPAVVLAAAHVALEQCRLGGCPCPALGADLEGLEKVREELGRRGPGEEVARVLLAAIRVCLARRSEVSGTGKPGLAGRPDMVELLAWTLLEQRRFDAARRRLLQVVAQFPARASAHLLLARAFVAAEQPEKAREVLEKVPAQYRGSEWYVVAAGVAMAARRPRDALRVLREGSKRFPENLALKLEEVRVLLRAGRATEAKRISEDLFRRHYTNARVLAVSAEVLLATGDLVRAAARLREALSKNPEDAVLHYRLGLVLRRQGRYERAKAHFKRAVANRPEFVRGWLALGRLERDLGRLEAAVSRYENLLARMPDAVDAMVELAETLLWLGRLDEASRRLGKVPEESRNFRWKEVAGLLAFRRGKVDRARRLLKEAFEAAAGVDRARIAAELARLEVEWDELDRAEQRLDTLEGRMRRRPEVRWAWGLVWLRRGKSRRARDRFRDALSGCRRVACPPRFRAILEAYLGRALYLSGSSRAAWRHLAAALRLDPNSAMAYYWHGVCAYEEGREGRAASFFQRAYRLDPGFPDIAYYLGEMARLDGRRRAAARWFRRYLRARPYGSLADQARESLRAVE